jgi:fatty acid desaturase
MSENLEMSWSGLNHKTPALQPSIQPIPEMCIANISPSERRRRLFAGIIQFAVAFAVLALLIRLGVNPWWRLGLFVPFSGAAIGVFQWRERT